MQKFSTDTAESVFMESTSEKQIASEIRKKFTAEFGYVVFKCLDNKVHPEISVRFMCCLSVGCDRPTWNVVVGHQFGSDVCTFW